MSLYKSRLIIEGMKAGEEHEGLGEEEKLVGGYAKKKRGAGVGTDPIEKATPTTIFRSILRLNAQ